MPENYTGDSNYPDQWRYRFGYPENSQFKNLMDGITFNQVTTLRLNDSSVYCIRLNDGPLVNCRDFPGLR